MVEYRVMICIECRQVPKTCQKLVTAVKESLQLSSNSRTISEEWHRGFFTDIFDNSMSSRGKEKSVKAAELDDLTPKMGAIMKKS